MSRIKSDKINLADSIVVDFFSNEAEEDHSLVEQNNAILENELSKINLMQKEAELKSQKILDDALIKVQDMLDSANQQAEEIKNKAQLDAQTIIEKADEILEQSKSQAASILETAKNDSIQIKDTASQEGAKEGYQAGYEDGLNKIKNELLQKIYGMDEVVKSAFEMKNKILVSSKNEIVELVLMIARKVCLNSVDGLCIAKILDKSFSFLNDKENIELILSDKYAKLLNQVLNDDITEQKADLKIDIDKLKNIKLVYNSKMKDDTLIVQTPKERLDLSFDSQLNEISKEFIKELNSSFDKKDEGEVGQV